MAFNTDLQDLSNDIIKKVYVLKQEKSVISSQDLKNIISICIDKKNIVTETTQLERLIAAFIEYKKRYTTSGTIQEYNTVFKALRDYQAKKGLSLSLGDFDKKFFSNFEDFLSNKENPKDENRGLLNDTIYKYIATLRVFLSWCQETGNDVNPEGLKKHKSPYKRKSHNEIVVLTEAELTKLFEHDLSERPAYERVRDVFCFACFTGQRYSDVARFNKKDFKDNKWTFLSTKTKKKVTVPFNGFIANALIILEKYNYELPIISNQKFNDYIKEIGELAGIKDPVRIMRFNGKQEVVIEKPKYDFMSSHMGRRTMVTILLSKGVPVSLVQKITQHSDIRTLMKYESAGMDSLVEALNKI